MFGYFVPTYLLILIPAILLSLAAQGLVSSAFAKWTRVRNGAGLTGVQVVEHLIQKADLRGVGLEGTEGVRTDHYDPASHTVRMSQESGNRAIGGGDGGGRA